jgi:hypothetical protein
MTTFAQTPKAEGEWDGLVGQMLMLTESADLLMLPGRARDQKQWMADAKLVLDAGTTCHKHYRPGYGQKPQLQ